MCLLLLSLFLLFGASSAIAEDPVTLDFPLLQTPSNFSDKEYIFPTMRQSLAASTDYYEGFHRALTGPSGEEPWRRWLVAGFDLISGFTPLGSAWLHEEWHRAVMSRRGISSFNDVYTFPIGASTIAVSHVSDEDLIRLKQDYAADSVRMNAAGMEAQIMQNQLFARHHFFDGTRTFDNIAMGMNALNVTFYLNTCAGPEADTKTDELNRADGSDIPKRDFTGLDCTAWVYDLFRPKEPYQSRGTHPSGTGVNRYIRYSDLTDDERSFLRRQVYLSLLNLLDPVMWGHDQFVASIEGEQIPWNARFAHYLTSFGNTVDLELYLKRHGHKYLLRLHNGMNDVSYFPGLSAEWIEHPIAEKWLVSTGATVWLQPAGQSVAATTVSLVLGGYVRLDYKYDESTTPYVGLEAKRPGWIAGNVFLDNGASIWTGLRVSVF